MIKEAYVSFEIAKLLKEKGFDVYCNTYYTNNGYFNSDVYGNTVNFCCEAPTHQMTLAWLREKHKHIIIDYREVSYKWYFRIPYCYNSFADNFDLFDTYEEATEEAIKFTLENFLI